MIMTSLGVALKPKAVQLAAHRQQAVRTMRTMDAAKRIEMELRRTRGEAEQKRAR